LGSFSKCCGNRFSFGWNRAAAVSTSTRTPTGFCVRSSSVTR
jgi:hypothetical protein